MIYLILIVMFADQQPSVSVKFLVPEGADACVRLVAAHMHSRPPPVMSGHPVKSWSATCSAELPGMPT